MRYLPKSPSERREMLDAIGVKTVEQLFQTIPEKFRLRESAESCPGRSPSRRLSIIFKAARG